MTLEALKWSQADLSRKTDISTQTINNLVTADYRPDVDDAIAICQVTGVTLDWIYRGSRALLPAAIAEFIARGAPGIERKRA